MGSAWRHSPHSIHSVHFRCTYQLCFCTRWRRRWRRPTIGRWKYVWALTRAQIFCTKLWQHHFFCFSRPLYLSLRCIQYMYIYTYFPFVVGRWTRGGAVSQVRLLFQICVSLHCVKSSRHTTDNRQTQQIESKIYRTAFLSVSAQRTQFILFRSESLIIIIVVLRAVVILFQSNSKRNITTQQKRKSKIMSRDTRSNGRAIFCVCGAVALVYAQALAIDGVVWWCHWPVRFNSTDSQSWSYVQTQAQNLIKLRTFFILCALRIEMDSSSSSAANKKNAREMRQRRNI